MQKENLPPLPPAGPPARPGIDPELMEIVTRLESGGSAPLPTAPSARNTSAFSGLSPAAHTSAAPSTWLPATARPSAVRSASSAPTSRRAAASMVLGIIGLCLFYLPLLGLGFPLVGLTLGKSPKASSDPEAASKAKTGVILSTIALILHALVFFWAMSS